MRCSKCSCSLYTPEQFDLGLCHSCGLIEGFNPNALAPDAFLRGLVELAGLSLDAQTTREAEAKLEVILLGLYPPPAQTYTASSSTPQGEWANGEWAMTRVEWPNAKVAS